VAIVWFLAWALVGAGAIVAVLSLPFLVIAIAPVAFLASRTGERQRSAWGLLVGVGAASLLLAYLNRHGPGEYCHAIGSPPSVGTECSDEWDPKPWLVAGVLLIVGGVAGQARTMYLRRHTILHG
jgi:hypothetical protein